MKTQLFTGFTGLDLRESGVLANPKAAASAVNLSLTLANEYTTRPGTRLIAELPASDTRGLYAFNGRLRTVAAGGVTGLAAKQPPKISFDYVGDGASYTGKLGGFISADIFGQGVFDTLPYLAIVRENGRVEHHWVRTKPLTVDAAVDTKINLPFAPSGGIVRAAQKIFAACNAKGSVEFSSSVNGPTDWTAVDDAGSIPVLQHIKGGREIAGLSQFQNKVVVWFRDGVQLWAVDPNPLNFFLTDVLDGPGCENPRAAANVAGDLFYLSQGGVRALSVVTVQGNLREGDIGAPVYPATKLLNAAGAVALWSPPRSQFFVAFGATVYVFTYSRLEEIQGWTTWNLPWAVTDLVENEGVLYARASDGSVYEFDDDLATDDGYGPISWTFQSNPHSMKSPGAMKMFQMLELHQEGTSTVSVLPNPTGVLAGPTVAGATTPFRRIPIQALSDAIALRLTGTGKWTLDGYTISYEQARG